MSRIDFQTSPDAYRHWRIEPDGEVARLVMDVDETAGLFDGYELKLNSYDLGVDIELADAIQRLRFEYPLVKDGCAGIGQGQGVLCRCQHPDAWRVGALAQGEFLQVHQRDPQLVEEARGRQRPDLSRAP